jgi:diamine N-acetyltransferase
VARETEVSLREVSPDTLPAVLGLSVSREQEAYVASNAKSIAEDHFHPEAWFRSIHAGNTPVGFLMIHDENLSPNPRQNDYYFLWRFMVAHQFQGNGFGRRALDLLVSHVRTRPNAHTLLTSCRPGEASPEPFYLKCRFRRTGRVEHGEIELAFRL